MNTYQAAVHGNTQGKQLSRQHVNEAIVEMVDKFGITNMYGYSLPSDAVVQEAELQTLMKYKGVNSFVLGIEHNKVTYNRLFRACYENDTSFKNGFFPYQVEVAHGSFYETVKHFGKEAGDGPQWFWYDACGEALKKDGYDDSNMEEYVDLLINNLDENGIGFFTANTVSRHFKLTEMYEQLTGEKVEMVHTENMVDAYIELLKSKLPTGYNLFYELIYPSTKFAFFVVGVAKGWTPTVKKINLVEKKKAVSTKTKEDNLQNKLIRRIIALTSKGVESCDIGKELGLSSGQVSAYKAHCGMGKYGDDFTARYGKAVIKLEVARKLRAVKEAVRSGMADEAIQSRFGISKMKVAGAKASITKELYA
jgi:hypothetical protein